MSNPTKIETDEEIINRHAPAVRRRARTELLIVHRVIQTLKAAGHKLTVDNGEDATVTDDEQTIVSKLFACDEGHIITDGGMSFVFFVFGNDGPDVINDYGVSLEEVLKPVNDWVDAESNAGRM